MEQGKLCTVDKTTGLLPDQVAATDMNKLLATREAVCGKPAVFKVSPDSAELAKFQTTRPVPAIAYVCEDHAAIFQKAKNVEVTPL